MANLSGKSAVTILARVYVTAGIFTAGKYTYFFKASNPSTRAGVTLRYYASAAAGWQAYYYGGTSDGTYIHSPTHNHETVGWHNLAAVIDGPNNLVGLYVDGDYLTVTGNVPDVIDSVSPFTEMHIGAPDGGWNFASWGNPYPPDGCEIQFVRVIDGVMNQAQIDAYFNGKVAPHPDLHFWNFGTAADGSVEDSATMASIPLPAALTANVPSEVRQQVIDLSPTHYWPLTETVGQGAMDAAPVGHHGTRVGGATLDPDGIIFDGVDDYVDLPDGFDNVSNGYSIYAEGKFTRTSGGNWERLVGLSNGSPMDNIHLGRNGTDATVTINHRIGSGASEPRPVGGDVSDNQYHKLLGVFNAAAGTLALYFDNGTSPVASVSGVAAPNDVIRTLCYLGNNPNTPTDAIFQGAIKHVAFFERTLDAGEIASLFPI